MIFYDNFTRHISYTIQVQQSHQVHYIRRTFQNRLFFLQSIDHFVKDWSGDKDFARVTASSRHLARFGEGPMAQSYNHSGCAFKQNLEHVRKTHRRLRSWNRRVDRAELLTEERLWFCELPDSPAHPAKLTQMTRSFMDRNDQRSHLPKQVHQPQHSHGRMDHGVKYRINHSQDSWDPSEYHNWQGLLESKRIIHRRQVDTADTVGEPHLQKAICQFILQLCILYFPA